MLIFWKIRYLDRNDRVFNDRMMFLNTSILPPVTKAAVELAIETKTNRTEREFLKYRPLFTEDNSPNATEQMRNADKMTVFSLHEYFEDENRNELSSHEMAQILTGSPTAVMVPAGTPEHHIDLMFAERRPIPVAEVSLTPEDLKLLGYFVRDYRELSESAFMRDGPGQMSSSGNSDPVLTTAVSDDEIRSFVTIFRRLYMKSERANFRKAVAVYVNAVGDHPSGRWVEAEGQIFETKLDRPPETVPFGPNGTCSFTRKRLIDVFLYTQYHHQPREDRQRQYEECLNELGGRRGVLTWLFLTELWRCGLEIGNSGRMIAAWFSRYCNHHGVTPDVLPSLRNEHAGIGTVEKEEDRRMRIFKEKAETLAMDLWNERGCPARGHVQFLSEAEAALRKAL